MASRARSTWATCILCLSYARFGVAERSGARRCVVQRLVDVVIGPETRHGDVRARAPPRGTVSERCEKARAQPGNELELPGMDCQKEATVTLTATVANARDPS